MKARDKNLASDPDYYSKLGKKGADAYNKIPKSERKPRGFAANPELASVAGTKGGLKSRRRKK
jgi:general stress protein YciG